MYCELLTWDLSVIRECLLHFLILDVEVNYENEIQIISFSALAFPPAPGLKTMEIVGNALIALWD